MFVCLHSCAFVLNEMNKSEEQKEQGVTCLVMGCFAKNGVVAAPKEEQTNTHNRVKGRTSC